MMLFGLFSHSASEFRVRLETEESGQDTFVLDQKGTQLPIIAVETSEGRTMWLGPRRTPMNTWDIALPSYRVKIKTGQKRGIFVGRHSDRALEEEGHVTAFMTSKRQWFVTQRIITGEGESKTVCSVRPYGTRTGPIVRWLCRDAFSYRPHH